VNRGPKSAGVRISAYPVTFSKEAVMEPARKVRMCVCARACITINSSSKSGTLACTYKCLYFRIF
jgi:hypothetical protein